MGKFGSRVANEVGDYWACVGGCRDSGLGYGGWGVGPSVWRGASSAVP